MHELPPLLIHEDVMPASPRAGDGWLMSRFAGSQETLVDVGHDESVIDPSDNDTLIGKESAEITGEGVKGSTSGVSGRSNDEEDKVHLKMVERRMLQTLADDRHINIVLGFMAGGEEMLTQD